MKIAMTIQEVTGLGSFVLLLFLQSIHPSLADDILTFCLSVVQKLHNFIVEKLKSRGDPRAKEKEMLREKFRATQDRTQMYGELLQQVHALFAEQLDGPYGQLLDRHRRSPRKLDGEPTIKKLAASPVIKAKLGKTGLRVRFSPCLNHNVKLQ